MREDAQGLTSAPAGPIPRWLGATLAPAYRLVINARNRAFDRGKGVVRLPIPVISVGNLSVGGTGKTPMVMHILGALLRNGHTPCVAMRGYGPGKRTTTSTSPDETDAYSRAFPDLPIVAQPDRASGLRTLLRQHADQGTPIDCVVLDDGFQHRQLARDLDIVLIDATRPPDLDRLLPAGWLREEVGSLRRASCVVITHAEGASLETLARLKRLVEREHGRPPIAVTRHLWTGLRITSDDIDHADQDRPLDALANRRVFACCAIGNPHAFIGSLKTTLAPLGGTLAGTLILPDHDPFGERTIVRLLALARESGANTLVVTDKDWSKLRHVAPERWTMDVMRPTLTMAFESGSDALEAALVRCVSRS